MAEEFDISRASIALEELLAAVIEYHGGRVEASAESFSQRTYDGKVIAIDFDPKKDVLVLTLVDKEDVIYDDDTE